MFINGELFGSLQSLIFVYLQKNKCIDEKFEGARKIASMPQTITENCGFDERSEEEKNFTFVDEPVEEIEISRAKNLQNKLIVAVVIWIILKLQLDFSEKF